MKAEELPPTPLLEDEDQIIEPLEFGFGLKRRTFVQLLATGLMISPRRLIPSPRNAAGGAAVAARETSANAFTSAKTVGHVVCGKVEVGQARAPNTRRLPPRNCACRSSECCS